MKYEPSADGESSQRPDSSDAKYEDPSKSVEASVVKRRSPTCKSMRALDNGPDKARDMLSFLAAVVVE